MYSDQGGRRLLMCASITPTFSDPHTHTLIHTRVGAWLSFTGLARPHTHFFFHQGFFPAACVFVGVHVCACVRLFPPKSDWTQYTDLGHPYNGKQPKGSLGSRRTMNDNEQDIRWTSRWHMPFLIQ